MIEVIIGVVCFLVGGALGFGVSKASEKEPIVITADPVAKELGRLDVVEPICKSQFVEKNGDGLCKFLMCVTQTNSAMGETSGQTCDNISNVENKKAIISFCVDNFKEKDDYENCVYIFFKRGS